MDSVKTRHFLAAALIVALWNSAFASASQAANQAENPIGYQASVTGSDCVDDDACLLVFSAVPASKTFAVRYVSCVTLSSEMISSASLFVQNKSSEFAAFAPAQSYEKKGFWYETYSSQTLFFVPGKNSPAIELVATGGAFHAEPKCFISGELAPA